MGGDMIDAACISHHNHGKPGATEGLKLLDDAKGGRDLFISPVEKIMGNKELVYIIGNHCAWLEDLTDAIPALEGLIDVRSLLKLDQRWNLIPQGEAYNLGKLTFVHGDQLKGGEGVAKAAVIAYERSVRFGHFHTYASYTKTSTIDYKLGKTGVAVPCLCTKNPKYGGGAPNRWAQGFLYGYVQSNGNFNDYVSIITDGQAIINGKLYKG